MNSINFTNQSVQIDDGVVYKLTDFQDVDISGVSSIISSLNYKSKINNNKQIFMIDPNILIQDLSSILIPNRIRESSEINFVNLYLKSDGKYEFEFNISNQNTIPEINETIGIEMTSIINNKSFGGIISEINGQNFKIQDKIISDSKLVQDILARNVYSYKIIRNSDSYLVNHQQLLILALITIKNLSNRIQILEGNII